jgi:hypothetical protein
MIKVAFFVEKIIIRNMKFCGIRQDFAFASIVTAEL